MEERQVLINLVLSLCLADHMGDAMDDAIRALKLIGIDVSELYDEDDFNSALMVWLGKNHGATTVWGTQVVEK